DEPDYVLGHHLGLAVNAANELNVVYHSLAPCSAGQAAPARFRHHRRADVVDDLPIIGPMLRFQLACLARDVGDVDRPFRIEGFDDTPIFEQPNFSMTCAPPRAVQEPGYARQNHPASMVNRSPAFWLLNDLPE